MVKFGRMCAIALCAMVFAFNGRAQTAAPEALTQNLVMPLWPGVAPGSENWTWAETVNGQTASNVVKPTLTAYLPEEGQSNGTAVIICPGGAFRMLSMADNGSQIAQWLNQKGITAFVLKYRLLGGNAGGGMGGGRGGAQRVLDFKNANANPEPDNKELANVIQLATNDGNQAIKLVRQNAEKWKLNPRRIGIMGFSAGGGVAVGSALTSDAESRPDFVATLYGPALVDVNVPREAPPLFIAVCADHPNVAPGCLALYSVWKAAGKSAELHVYSDGRAGFSLRKQNLTSDAWMDQLYSWMKVRKMSEDVQK